MSMCTMSEEAGSLASFVIIMGYDNEEYSVNILK